MTLCALPDHQIDSQKVRNYYGHDWEARVGTGDLWKPPPCHAERQRSI